MKKFFTTALLSIILFSSVYQINGEIINQFENFKTGEYLDSDEFGNVYLRPRNDGPHQDWINEDDYDSYGALNCLRNKATNRYLTYRPNENRLRTERTRGGCTADNQLWIIENHPYLQHASTKYIMDGTVRDRPRMIKMYQNDQANESLNWIVHVDVEEDED